MQCWQWADIREQVILLLLGSEADGLPHDARYPLLERLHTLEDCWVLGRTLDMRLEVGIRSAPME